jgi:hypothetical protein
LIVVLLVMLNRSYMARLKDKDDEIQRLADANKEMLAIILKNPLSSLPSGKKDKKK